MGIMTEVASIWRLIDTGPLPGPDNMAIDEALLRSFDPQTSSPVLRLYGWTPPSLSLGRFQKGAEVLDLEHCQSDHVPIVRRITGGGVIYHADELTYSIICGPGHIPPVSSVKDSFRVLTGFLLAFYRSLGLAAAYAADVLPHGTVLGERTAFCFAGKETFDILIGGAKIGGNAQRRVKGAIFQHGSVPLVNRAGTGLSYMKERLPEHALGATSLGDCGISGHDRLPQLLAASFETYFAVTVRPDELSQSEQQIAAELLVRKYSSNLWNLDGVE